MSILRIRRDEAIKLIHDRTNAYQLDKMSDDQLTEFISKIGYGIDVNVPYYGWKFKIKEDEIRKKT
jgi:hypothetical protein